MGLSSAIDWWDEWKLRILVLCTLFVQFFLAFSGFARTRYNLRWLRVLVWIAYIGGDALAVYALATLFNRQKETIMADGGRGGNSTLEVIWAPVLLIHLGGQPSITAYSLEDNELWKRHAITLVSQVTVALYVFCKWWSGEKRLLQAAVLLFIVGILRFSERPWALQRASFGANNLPSPPREETSSSVWSRLLCCCTRNLLAGEEEETMGHVNYSLEEYVQEARKQVKQVPKASVEAQRQEYEKNPPPAMNYICNMFVDLSAPYSLRVRYLRYFLMFEDKYQHAMLRKWILQQFGNMYTRIRSICTCLGCSLTVLLPMLALASVVLFAVSKKDGYSKSDITVTYILFSGTVVTELSLLWINLLRSTCLCSDGCYYWQDMVSQHNVILFCARKKKKKKKPSALMKFGAVISYLRDYINKHWCIRHEHAAQQISVLVHGHAEYGWTKYIRDAATYKRFNNLRGDHTLRKHHLLGEEQLGWSINLPFDECVLLWHIATDLCLHHTNYSRSNTTRASSSHDQSHQAGGIESRSRCSTSEIISNYMIYLLFICPEMLIPGTRSDLFVLACNDIETMTKDESPPSSLDERRMGIAQQILGMEQQGDDQLMNKLAPTPRISNARKLARVLIDHLNEEERWEVIQGVWVEMLCYSASRCRGYQHAKSLAYGGEYLTNVWLLWSFMGMETLPDKIHNPGPPEPDPAEEQDAAAALV